MPTPIRSLRVLALATGAIALATAALAADPDVTRFKTDGGEAYADANGMALYTFDKDTDGKSMCNGDCAAKWPPLMAPADASASGDFAPITRDDGTMQWAMGGKPLYTFAKDTKAGETTGEGMGGVWHLAK